MGTEYRPPSLRATTPLFFPTTFARQQCASTPSAASVRLSCCRSARDTTCTARAYWRLSRRWAPSAPRAPRCTARCTVSWLHVSVARDPLPEKTFSLTASGEKIICGDGQFLCLADAVRAPVGALKICTGVLVDRRHRLGFSRQTGVGFVAGEIAARLFSRRCLS